MLTSIVATATERRRSPTGPASPSGLATYTPLVSPIGPGAKADASAPPRPVSRTSHANGRQAADGNRPYGNSLLRDAGWSNIAAAIGCASEFWLCSESTATTGEQGALLPWMIRSWPAIH